ncbi:hypothetical protein BJX70DRAFT_18742 [Aspergillus crustosus]
MHYFKTLVLMLSIFLIAVSALEVLTDENTPDAWLAYSNIESRTDLDLAEPSSVEDDSSITTVFRTPVTVCTHNPLGKCTHVDDQFALSWNLSYMIYQQSRFRDCKPLTATTSDGKFKYTYYATGHRCDTTARPDTLAGAINHFLDKVSNHEICGTICLRLNHGGTWDGWLKIGETKRFNNEAYCGEALHFDRCASGGKNDIR